MGDWRICSICKLRKPIKDITPYTRSGTHHPICKDCVNSNEATRLQLVQLLGRHCNNSLYDRFDHWPEGIARHTDREGCWVFVELIPIDNAIQRLRNMMESYRVMAKEVEDGLAALAR